MSLYQIYSDLQDEFLVAENSLLTFASNKPANWSIGSFAQDDIFYLDGWVSYVWQGWCKFCRSCLINSILGTTTGSGSITTKVPNASSEYAVSGASILAAKKKPIQWNPNAVLRLEPTWGDVDKINNIATRLNPSNEISILSGASMGSTAAKDFQTIRNACAHLNLQTGAEVSAINTRYITFPINHPTQSLFWSNPVSKDFLAIHTLDELLNSGFIMIG